MKARVRADKLQAEEAKTAAVGLGGLAGYGDSDEDGSDENDEDALPESVVRNRVAIPDTDDKDEDAAQAGRRARAKEWAEQRRAQS